MEPLNEQDPRTVAGYRVLARLGAGGMGQVYLARSPGGRRVAMKVVRPELADDPEFRARFAREVTSARAVSGAFTAAVVDADPMASPPWLATEFVPGPSLTEFVREHGPLPAWSVWRLAAGLAEALAAVHTAGVVHRDLKPSNVLLDAEGPRLIDFGISKAAEASQLTRTGMVVGSPGFMSPEQIEGNAADEPSDVFSLGAVLAYAASGSGPFGEGATPALLYRVVHREPELDRIPVELHELVARCLRKTPEDRPTPEGVLNSATTAIGELPQDADSEQTGWLPPPLTMAVGRHPAAEPLDSPPPGYRTPSDWRSTGAAWEDAAGSPGTPAGARPVADTPATGDPRIAAAAFGAAGGSSPAVPNPYGDPESEQDPQGPAGPESPWGAPAALNGPGPRISWGNGPSGGRQIPSWAESGQLTETGSPVPGSGAGPGTGTPRPTPVGVAGLAAAAASGYARPSGPGAPVPAGAGAGGGFDGDGTGGTGDGSGRHAARPWWRGRLAAGGAVAIIAAGVGVGAALANTGGPSTPNPGAVTSSSPAGVPGAPAGSSSASASHAAGDPGSGSGSTAAAPPSTSGAGSSTYRASHSASPTPRPTTSPSATSSPSPTPTKSKSPTKKPTTSPSTTPSSSPPTSPSSPPTSSSPTISTPTTASSAPTSTTRSASAPASAPSSGSSHSSRSAEPSDSASATAT